jgi:hypothetical protein
MLVNASRFTEVQRQLRNEIHALVDRIRSSIRVNGGLKKEQALQDFEIGKLHVVWEREFAADSGLNWDEIHSLLNESIGPISVVEVNSNSTGSLAYRENEKHGLNVIAVGGFSLSRGLTLEGLIISYFLRNSMMYDTLMQMGRWFGYRPGYEDLCRVWMPEEAEGWYAHVAESIEELRDEFRKMESVRATPEQFGLKVRSHPDTLIVTARNKMGSGEQFVVSIGLANKLVETSVLKRDSFSLQTNRNSAINLSKALERNGTPLSAAIRTSGGYLLTKIDVGIVINFLTSFVNHNRESVITSTGPVCEYIKDRANLELEKWDILFPSLNKVDIKGRTDLSLGVPINCSRRSESSERDPDTLRIGNNRRIATGGIEMAGLSDEQIEEAEQAYRDRNSNKSKDGNWNYPDKIYREKRERPLLIVHLLIIGNKDDDLSDYQPVVAWSISFPGTKLEEKKVSYVVNTTWLRENYSEEFGEEMDGDNG